MEEHFKVYILKFRINNIDRYLADLEGTLSLSKSDSVIFNSREKAYQYAGKLENFYESAGLIATVIDEEIGINEWKILNNYQARLKL
ncbi:hypothetical protein [Peptoniphilus duerdenii]|uniref:hypothetical protein n=1 Tax=Peptoniphilus duerdenii TaxID=507750 RepID=UPI0028898634|nr:hypothetical protein [Peptoniphilus duerdenii]